MGLAFGLPRVQGIAPGDHAEQQRHIAGRGADRSRMVQGQLDGKHARAGDEPISRLQPIDPAPGGGDPDRPALIAAQRHIDAARRDQGRAPAGGAAGRMAMAVGVVDGAQMIGMAAAGEAEVLAGSLADDPAAGGEDPFGDRGVEIRDVAFEERCAVAHRHAGEAGRVLEGDGATGERSVAAPRTSVRQAQALRGLSSGSGRWPGPRGYRTTSAWVRRARRRGGTRPSTPCIRPRNKSASAAQLHPEARGDVADVVGGRRSHGHRAVLPPSAAGRLRRGRWPLGGLAASRFLRQGGQDHRERQADLISLGETLPGFRRVLSRRLAANLRCRTACRWASAPSAAGRAIPCDRADGRPENLAALALDLGDQPLVPDPVLASRCRDVAIERPETPAYRRPHPVRSDRWFRRAHEGPAEAQPLGHGAVEILHAWHSPPRPGAEPP